MDMNERLKLFEEHEEFIKQCEKAHQLKYLVPCKEGDFLYFCGTGKKKKEGIISKEGKVIVPFLYDNVKFYPPMQEGMQVSGFGEHQTIVWCQKNDGVFVAHNYKNLIHPHYAIYRTDGTLIFDMEVEEMYTFIPGYFEIKVADKTQSNHSLYGLYTQDGKEILPIECDIIHLQGKVCKYHKEIGDISSGGSYMKGALMLDGSLPAVPCQFREVEYDSIHHHWLVKEDYQSDWEVYNDHKHYVTEMKDDGVKYFWEGKYDETIKYYSGVGISQPWAKYYSGAAMLEKANDQYYKCLRFIDDVKSNKINAIASNGVSNRAQYMNMNPDFELMKQLFSTGYSMLKLYICEDSTFLENVHEYTFFDLESRLRGVDDLKEKFTPYWIEFQKKNAAISEQQEKLRREKQEREKALYQAFITGFINGINKAISGNAERQNNSVSTRNVNASDNVDVYNGNVTNSQNTSSGSNTRRINYTALADWKARKARAERMIQEYNNQLLRDPNDAAIKSMKRSQENILNNCIRQISLIESGAY